MMACPAVTDDAHGLPVVGGGATGCYSTATKGGFVQRRHQKYSSASSSRRIDPVPYCRMVQVPVLPSTRVMRPRTRHGDHGSSCMYWLRLTGSLFSSARLAASSSSRKARH